ncbi:hypothetical protein F53441_8359 [Fusarium austroafricanum]|uniref:Thioredoxin domain-containing protein n=1 Tax=Fusarium austroafricanum TaxID=2364996 RepID=A0A8H4KF87_9HYPO|nr:hypothetical protein F53441_8359 [Fusarium austroafricanum]
MHTIPLRTGLRTSCGKPRMISRLLQRASISSTAAQQAKNQIYAPIRNNDSFSTYLSLSTSSRTPLLTLWTASWCSTCKAVTPLIQDLVESGVGEEEGGVSLATVEFDSQDIMSGSPNLAMTYMITSIPTLLSFDAGEAQTTTKLSDARKLADRGFLKEWVRTEARRHGGRGGGGGGGGSSVFGGLFDGDESTKDTGIVLISFMRDGTFWREGSAKLGLDLDTLNRTGRFTFIDGLSGLYGNAKSPVPGARRERVLRSTSLIDIKKEIEGAVADLHAARKVLIIDQLDTLLAVTDDSTTSLTLQTLILSLRSLVHSTLLTLSADTPLVAAQATTLEREHASLVLSTAHAADLVLALRMLDTGTARDVSGVVRITGPGVDGLGGAAEYLYHIVADGGVKVFERGT